MADWKKKDYAERAAKHGYEIKYGKTPKDEATTFVRHPDKTIYFDPKMAKRFEKKTKKKNLPEKVAVKKQDLPDLPDWAKDLPIYTHPNDIRTLIRVVNELGQEVNPSNQFNGSVLFYIYNDGTIEKRIK